MTWGDSPTSAGLAGVGSTSPARWRLVADMLLCLLRLCLISGNFLHACFLHPCLHIMLAMYSEFGVRSKLCIHSAYHRYEQ
jgi:hypothetical protein